MSTKKQLSNIPHKPSRRPAPKRRNTSPSKRTNELLNETQQRLALAIHSANIGLWDWDLRTNRVYFSLEWKSQLGYEVNEISDDFSEWEYRVHPEDVARAKATVNLYLEKPYPNFQNEFRMRHKDGSYRWILAQASLLTDEQGKPRHMLGSHIDITERKHAEDKIERQNKRLKILHEIDLAILAADSVNDIVGAAFNHIRELVDCRRASLTLIDWETNEVVIFAIRAADGASLLPPGSRLPLAQFQDVIPTLSQNQPMVFSDLRALAEPTPAIQRLLKDGLRSTCSLPLFSQGNLIGMFSMHSEIPGFFDEEKMRLGREIANQVAIAITQKRLMEGLHESEQKFSLVFRRAPFAISLSRLPDGVIVDANEEFEKLAGYSREEVIGKTSLELNMYPDPDTRARMAAEFQAQGFMRDAELVLQTKSNELRTLLINTDFIEIAQGKHVLTTAQDITRRKQTEDRVQRQLQQLHALRAIDQAITSGSDLRVTLSVLLEQVKSQLGVDATAILLSNPLMATLEFAAGLGFHSRVLQPAQLRLGEGYAGQAALERRTIHVANVIEAGGDLARYLFLNQESFVAYYGVPLIAKGQVKGVLEIFHRVPLDPDPEWLDFLETLAGQAAIAINDAQMFDGLQRSNTELLLAYDATIEGWSRAMDLRDKETEGHTLRVTEMTVQLARAAGISNEEIVQVRRGALLHDMGKLGVPDSILLKPDKLTDEEWLAMKKHPQYAYEMLSPIKYLRAALDIPYCHHEEWDGTGYPRGLKGEQIPFAARLFAVVDVWDALRSDRPYRAGWPQEQVLEYIRAQAGTHFDPKAVELFFQVLSEREHNSGQSAG